MVDFDCKQMENWMQKGLFWYLPDNEWCLFWWPKTGKAVSINFMYELTQSQDKRSEECCPEDMKVW